MLVDRLLFAAVAALALASDQPRAVRAAGPSAMTLDEALRARRSVRELSGRGLSAETETRLCWAAQGITDPNGLRTAPSAGAIYPLTVYLVDSKGVFRYEPRRNALVRVGDGDRREALARAALGQPVVRGAGTDLVFAASFERTRAKYGGRGDRYVYLEAGHAAENALLEATSLGLGAVPIGAFDDAAVGRAVGLPADEAAVYLVAVGYRAD